jgi:hypothetical protein
MLIARAQQRHLFARTFHSTLEKATIGEFLEDINRHSGILVEYASNYIDTGKIITLTGSPATIGALLQQVLHHQPLNILERNNKIILTPATVPLPDNFFVPSHSVYGIIKESVSGEPLANATLLAFAAAGGGQRGSYSNNHGYYTLSLPEGKQILTISYAGYNSQQLEIDVQHNTRIDIHLIPKSDIEEVAVIAATKPVVATENKVITEAGAFNTMMGEPDALRSLYIQPGVKNIAEITNGMLVRGGSPDQNVFLLDGNRIFNPTHLLGMVSIINKTSLKSVNLYKSNFPSRFGGGLSSVIDVTTKDGNMQQWKGEANVGLLAGSFTVEGPLKKDRSSLVLSFRRSWINPLLKIMDAGIGINFYDVQAKYTQWIGKKDKLMLNMYAGHDRLQLHQNYNNNQQQWGNKVASLTWNHLLSARAFVNTSFSVNHYDNMAGFRYSLYDSAGKKVMNKVYNTYASIRHYQLRTLFEISTSNTVKMIFGGRASYLRIRPFDSNISDVFIDNPDDFKGAPPLLSREAVVFYENEIRPNKKIFLRPGIHVSHFNYSDFNYISFQPRLYASYKLGKRHQVDAAYNHMTQYLHLVTNPYLGINSDAWVPSTSKLRPEESDMINAGYTYTNNKRMVIGAEVYYKMLKNVTNYAEGKNLFLNSADWGQYVQSGRGWSYGIETKVQKTTQKWYMHLGYTLSWNWRKFIEINNGKKFPFKYDRRHDLNIAATYLHNRRWNFSALWMFATGDVYSLPSRVYPDFDDAQQISDPLAPREYRLIYHSSGAYQYRTLPYHRLDVSASLQSKIGKHISNRLTMGVYNMYGSPNQYMFDLEGTLGKRSLVVTTRYQFFRITPYVSCTVAF